MYRATKASRAGPKRGPVHPHLRSDIVMSAAGCAGQFRVWWRLKIALTCNGNTTCESEATVDGTADFPYSPGDLCPYDSSITSKVPETAYCNETDELDTKTPPSPRGSNGETLAIRLAESGEVS